MLVWLPKMEKEHQGSGASDGSGSKAEKEEEEATISSDESGASGPTNGETPAPKVKPTQKGQEKDGSRKLIKLAGVTWTI